MATHSSTPAWKIPRMEEPCMLQSLVSQRVRHDWVISFSLSLSYLLPFTHLLIFIVYYWTLAFHQLCNFSCYFFCCKNTSVLQHSAFFTVQLSHPYMTTGKTIALTRRTFVGKVMSLFLNMLSRLVITLCNNKTIEKTIAHNNLEDRKCIYELVDLAKESLLLHLVSCCCCYC